MNEATDIQALKIAQYLEDRMSPQEEAAFMEELNSDEALKKSFEEALVLREVLAAHVEPAPRVLSLFRVRAIAAACVAVIFICFGVARLGVRDHRYASDDVRQYPVTLVDSGRAGTALRPDSLYARFYSVYVGEKDPVEISLYYQRYRAGDYASVLAAREEDYRLMGTGKKANLLNQYMQLYRGLSYLSERQPVRALGQFDSLLNSPPLGKELYASAQWYAVLATLQRRDIPADSALAAAARRARVIGETVSPYRVKAASLLELLHFDP